ncbi:hypothetical protein [Microbacterium sp. zg.Y909]|uniref:hypothetical protein n=1 Tax=Microbacterium sp. zg.Y909 TaxID=2969413 RepID=UPI00214B285D|nr:hypothetical protein [Microbacterium sp. zg.Y909]MCR2824962.1 hypothetical protein [Microbacterium sp. zg.Y909]
MNQKYSVEMRERALRMLDEAKPEHPNLTSAVRHVAGLLGVSATEIKRLQKENAELRKANEILKAPSVFFAKELDRDDPVHR